MPFLRELNFSRNVAMRPLPRRFIGWSVAAENLQRKKIIWVGWFNSACGIWRPPGSARTAERGNGECSGRGIDDGALDDLRLRADQRPRIGGKDDDGDVSADEVLLENHVLVAGDESLETGLLGDVE
jgi:hypothetical protein